MISVSQRGNYRKVAYNLYTIRTAKNLSQEQLSIDSSVERSKISRIENYKEDFLFSTILNLADALGVTIDKILDLNIVVPETFEKDKRKKAKAKKK